MCQPIRTSVRLDDFPMFFFVEKIAMSQLKLFICRYSYDVPQQQKMLIKVQSSTNYNTRTNKHNSMHVFFILDCLPHCQISSFFWQKAHSFTSAYFNFSALQTPKYTFANSVDPNNEPSHQELHCLPFCF